MFTLVGYTELGHAVTHGQEFNNPVEAMDYGRRAAGVASVGRLVLFENDRKIATLDTPEGKWH